MRGTFKWKTGDMVWVIEPYGNLDEAEVFGCIFIAKCKNYTLLAHQLCGCHNIDEQLEKMYENSCDGDLCSLFIAKQEAVFSSREAAEKHKEIGI